MFDALPLVVWQQFSVDMVFPPMAIEYTNDESMLTGPSGAQKKGTN